jgi:hypothetical protein
LSDERNDDQERSANPTQPELGAQLDPMLPGRLPRELEALGKAEVRAVFEEALLLGYRWTKSQDRARALVSDLYVKITTTQRWDPTRAPLRVFVLQTLRHLLRHEPMTERISARERKAMEGFHREIRPERVDSAEEMHLEKAYYAARHEASARRLAKLEERLEQRGLGLARRIVDAYREKDYETRTEVADDLGVPVQQVYRAIETMRYHLEKIVEEETAEGKGEKK